MSKNKPYWQVRRDQILAEREARYEAREYEDEYSIPSRREVLNSRPIALRMPRLPSLEQQVHELTRIGAMRREAMDRYMFDEILDEDDWQDHLDDLPDIGISPHEFTESEIERFARSEKKRLAKAAKAPKKAPSPPTPEAPHTGEGGGEDGA